MHNVPFDELAAEVFRFGLELGVIFSFAFGAACYIMHSVFCMADSLIGKLVHRVKSKKDVCEEVVCDNAD